MLVYFSLHKIELIKIIKKDYLIVDKPSRKTTILEIGFDHKDEILAKTFNENFYINRNTGGYKYSSLRIFDSKLGEVNMKSTSKGNC